MTQRLPTPGSDAGNWGNILNGFLEVSHASDGTLNSNTVGTSQLQAGSVTNAELDVPTQTTLAAVASKYVKPPTGIPASDLASAVQTNLTQASLAVQTVNSISPTAGNVNLTAATIGSVPTSQVGAPSGVATLDANSKLTASQLPVGIISRTVSSIAYSTIITPTLPSGDAIYIIGTLTGALTLNAPSGTPFDGQMIQFIFTQDATGGRAITYGAGYAFGSDVTAALDPGVPASTWRRLFAYNAAASSWQALAIVRGF